MNVYVCLDTHMWTSLLIHSLYRNVTKLFLAICEYILYISQRHFSENLKRNCLKDLHHVS